PPAHLVLDVVWALHSAKVEPDLSELLDFGRREACRIAGSDHGDVVSHQCGQSSSMTLSIKSRGDLAFPAWGKWRSPASTENSMFQLLRTRSVRPYCSSVAVEEERVWIAF